VVNKQPASRNTCLFHASLTLTTGLPQRQVVKFAGNVWGKYLLLKAALLNLFALNAGLADNQADAVLFRLSCSILKLLFSLARQSAMR
jgi:hypothetical protein